MRIASLLPSATEIVCALGARADLVGISHECDHPVGVGLGLGLKAEGPLPVLTRPRVSGGSSAEIDRDVRAVLRAALAVYEVEVERLRDARPDVIVTQDLCDVCAVSRKDVEGALAQLATEAGWGGTTLINLHPTGLDDIWTDVARTGAGIGRRAEGEALAERLRTRVAELGAEARRATHRPRVLAIEWLDPVMIGGLWMPELISLAGGTPMVTRPREHAPTLSLGELAQLDPDVVFIKPCGFDLKKTTRELETLTEKLPWSSWRAVREGRVFVADGNAFFNRSGPRIVESLELLAACLHPERFASFAQRHSQSVFRLDATLSRVPTFQHGA